MNTLAICEADDPRTSPEAMMGSSIVATMAVAPLLPLVSWLLIRVSLVLLGVLLRHGSHDRRQAIYAQYEDMKKKESKKKNAGIGTNPDKTAKTSETKISSPLPKRPDFNGFIGFFHPFCNAGGGGERVLWAAIEATQRRYPKAICAVYTCDHELDVAGCVTKVKNTFDITLKGDALLLIYLAQRHWVVASTWPHFTLLGQSIGSLILTFEALSLLDPDIFIDTMGYAFGVALCKLLFPKVPTGAYVHYPTISTDMLESLDDRTGTKGLNAGQGSGWKGKAKKAYWHAFAWLYGWVGNKIDVVMCNSTWTSNHIAKLWGSKNQQPSTAVVYPPCPVETFEERIDVSEATEDGRENIILYLAQFRPEKNHSLILRAFSKHYRSTPNSTAKLVLIGSVRSNSPDEKHVYSLRLLARELGINDATKFICDAPFSKILEYLQISNISVNGMYNEHFGIGNVEGLAAGLIPVVHNSGGPKLDIVVPYQGQEIGFHADNLDEFASAFAKIDKLGRSERIEMRLRGRRSTHRFSEAVFAKKWDEVMDRLVGMARAKIS